MFILGPANDRGSPFAAGQRVTNWFNELFASFFCSWSSIEFFFNFFWFFYTVLCSILLLDDFFYTPDSSDVKLWRYSVDLGRLRAKLSFFIPTRLYIIVDFLRD
jgi:hypothetical protein